MAIYDNRICRECGVTFSGGPRAWYCEECRHERRKRRDRETKGKPSKRPIGSKDVCLNCGQEYIVNGGLQKYCLDCKEKMYKEIDNRQGKAYYRGHYSTEDKRAARSEKRRVKYEKNKDKINATRRERYKQKKAIDH